jgi:hypothetical protein
MSARTEVVQKAHEALNAGDIETLVALCDSAVRLDMSDRVLNPPFTRATMGSGASTPR